MSTDIEMARSGKHIPALDGVRGFAILLVLLYHSSFFGGSRSPHVVDVTVRQMFSFGWAGVDLFFVLSGLLITGILLDSRDSPYYYRSFYARRVLRIFPLYFAFLASVLWILPLVREMEPSFATFRQEQVWYWTYLFNWRVASEGWPDFRPLGHFWSLGVEEQFYLFWPLVVMLFRRQTLARICVGLILGSLALRIWLVFGGWSVAAYVLTPGRLDALAMGSLLAIWVRNPATHPVLARHAPRLLLVCVLTIGAVFLIHGSFWPWGTVTLTLGLSLATLASASLLATVLLRPDLNCLARIFRSPGMRFLGKYSYGIYVVHHPLVFFLGRSRLRASDWPQWGDTEVLGTFIVMAIGIGLSIAIALLSWNLLEAPFLRMKRHFPYRPR